MKKEQLERANILLYEIDYTARIQKILKEKGSSIGFFHDSYQTLYLPKELEKEVKDYLTLLLATHKKQNEKEFDNL